MCKIIYMGGTCKWSSMLVNAKYVMEMGKCVKRSSWIYKMGKKKKIMHEEKKILESSYKKNLIT